jgi:hypothetical protein
VVATDGTQTEETDYENTKARNKYFSCLCDPYLSESVFNLCFIRGFLILFVVLIRVLRVSVVSSCRRFKLAV